MQTLYGVPKSSYRAFQFIAQQPDAAVPVHYMTIFAVRTLWLLGKVVLL
jgi:hypothetical protein